MRSIFVLFLFAATTAQFIPETEWGAKGLSTTEHQLIVEMGISYTLVDSILSYGVGIREFYNKPWAVHGASVGEYMALRRKGLTAEQVSYRLSRKKQVRPSSNWGRRTGKQ
jgi:hypothetical protein